MADDAIRGFDMRKLAGDRWPVPDWHLEKIRDELACDDPRERMLAVMGRMGGQEAPDFSGLDWDAELRVFGEIHYPSYYRQPFHSVPGGYLSEAAAVGDRRAMEAIYQEAHPRRSLGVRDALAALVPEEAESVVDLGSGTGDAPAAVARRLPRAQVVGIEASPFMVVAGRHQNPEPANLELRQGFAESTGLATGSVDVVTITLVFHECPDTIKRTILAECRRILRPGGTLVLSDTPKDDLHGFRGFYEPYKEEWRVFEPVEWVSGAGFESVEEHDVAPPLWSVTARSPGPAS